MKKKDMISILGFLTIMFLVTAIIYLTVIDDIDEMVKEQVNLYLSESIDQHINTINTKINDSIDMHNSLALTLSKYDDLGSNEVYEVIKEQANIDGFNRLIVINSDGSAYTNEGVKLNLGDKDFFKASISGETYVSDFYESDIDNVTYIVISVPIYKQGKVFGVLASIHYADIIDDLLKVVTFQGDGYNYIISRHGNVILKTNSKDSNINLFDILSEATILDDGSVQKMKNNIASDKEGVLKYIYKNELKYIKYKPIMKNGWYIISILPSNKIDGQSYYISFLVFILCIMIFIMFALMMFIVSYINRKKEKVLIKRAESDSFTNLRNKAATKSQIDRYIGECDENCKNALILLDIDNFKKINDTYGHHIGDNIILESTSIIKNMFRTTDIIGRVGGDEFVVFLENISSSEALEIKLKEIINVFANIKLPDNKISVSASLGVALFPKDGSDYDELFNKADEALYMSKAKGKGAYTIYK